MRVLITILLLGTLGCRPAPTRSVHPPGEDLSSHEMFDFIVGRCIEVKKDFYAMGYSSGALPPPMGELVEELDLRGYLQDSSVAPDQIDAAALDREGHLPEESPYLAHYEPGTRFKIDTVLKHVFEGTQRRLCVLLLRTDGARRRSHRSAQR